jgi:hypothetical protein
MYHGLPGIPSSKSVLSSRIKPPLNSLQWLIDQGRPDEGLKTLARLHSNGNQDDPWVRAEFDQIQESVTHERENEAKSYIELFTDRSCLYVQCPFLFGTFLESRDFERTTLESPDLRQKHMLTPRTAEESLSLAHFKLPSR